MNWSETLQNLYAMKGMRLHSISGRSDFVLTDIDNRQLTLSIGPRSLIRFLDEIHRIIGKMDILTPIHVDSLLLGSGSSRNQPETILANMPDVEWVHLNKCKHIVWVGRHTHKLGTLKQLDTYNTAQLKIRYKGRGPVVGQMDISILIMASNVRIAFDFVNSVFKVSDPEALPDGKGYIFSLEKSRILLIPVSEVTEVPFEILPVLKVPDKQRALAQLINTYPESSIRELKAEGDYIIVKLPHINAFVLK